ncbi:MULTISPECIES: VOC family protein [unclassified Streptomyces]|uniref:VOC family protein n=1 Tax=unclassified Streptomyces TaxID=2593676 RepID=UPI0029A8C469|nr:VOC family protein [Streptomyces sp. FL07-04A]MDX3575843.1 VOC family protein [Streptomyces sp. FL07-04A]
MAENRASVYAEGVPCWVDAQLPDVDAGKRFYGELFGWDFEDAYGSSVWASLDGARVAGLAHKTDGRMPTVWTVYFATPDAEATARRIQRAGGQMVTAPLPVDGGAAALAADPEGAVFGLWQAAGHPGFGVRHRPGAFAWAQLYARDTEAANTFYGHLFHEALFGPQAEPDFGRAPVGDVFPEIMPAHFLVHFGVRDCEAALGAVSRLGGRVQAGPFTASYGIVAVVTDNQGASFALLQR